MSTSTLEPTRLDDADRAPTTGSTPAPSGHRGARRRSTLAELLALVGGAVAGARATSTATPRESVVIAARWAESLRG